MPGGPGEDKGPLGAVMEGEQSACSGRSLTETVQIVGVVLQAAVVVAPCHWQRAEAQRQPHVVVADGVWWCIHLRKEHHFKAELPSDSLTLLLLMEYGGVSSCTSNIISKWSFPAEHNRELLDTHDQAIPGMTSATRDASGPA